MPGRTTPSGPGLILNDPVPAPPGFAAGEVEAAGASAMAHWGITHRVHGLFSPFDAVDMGDDDALRSGVQQPKNQIFIIPGHPDDRRDPG